MRRWGLVLCTLLALASWTIAADEPSLERGKDLFTSTGLGKNGKSCANCHLGGRRLGRSGDGNELQLAVIANQCLTKTMKGEAFPPGSVEMRSLLLYMNNMETASR